MAKFRFAFLLELAREERENAAQRMQEAQGNWLMAQGKLEQLDQYRVEYRARLATSSQTGLTVSQWRDFQLFLAKLDHAAAQQQTEINRLQGVYEASREQWQLCERKVKAFEALETRHLQAEQLRENRREQKTLDDFNSRSRS